MPIDTESTKAIFKRVGRKEHSDGLMSRLLNRLLDLVDIQWARISNHIFPVKVLNQKEFPSSFDISNLDQDRLSKDIVNSVNRISEELTRLHQKIDKVRFPENQQISGDVTVKDLQKLIDKPFPKFPSKIDVVHQKAILSTLKQILKKPESKEVRVSNLSDISIPDPHQVFSEEDKKFVIDLLENLQFIRNGMTVSLSEDDRATILSTTPTGAISVPSFVNENGPARQDVDVLSGYRPANRDSSSSSPRYTGSVKADGHWYVMRETRSSNIFTYEYAAGTSDYSTNWTNRASLSYDTFDNVF